MNLALITSGGDSPGMNACLAQIVKEADIKGHIVYAYKRGFIGIKEDDFIKLKTQDVQGWHKQSGTLIKTGRFPQLKEKKWQEILCDKLKKNGIDTLIVLGGDGSFNGALALHKINKNLNIIGIPCTIDNNIYGSNYTIGFDTALNTQMKYIDGLDDTGLSMQGRIFFVETLGAWDGYLPQSSVLMGMADFSVLCEAPISDDE